MPERVEYLMVKYPGMKLRSCKMGRNNYEESVEVELESEFMSTLEISLNNK